MNSIKRLIIWAFAIIIGYSTIVIFAFISQDLFFGGLSMPGSPIHHLLIGGTLTTFGAFVGGYLLAVVANERPIIPSIILALWILFEGSYLYVSGVSTNYLWFDIVATLSLSLAVILGCFYQSSRLKKRDPLEEKAIPIA